MSTAVQRRRGTNTEHNSFTGLEGEISVNTTNESLHVHDGSTAGGFEMARADMDNVANIDDTIIGANTPAAGTFTTLTSNGIDDNATTEVLQLQDTVMSVGGNSGAGIYDLVRRENDGSLIVSGGNSSSAGFNITMYGGGHATLPDYMRMRAGATTVMFYDDSAGRFELPVSDVVVGGESLGAASAATLYATGAGKFSTGSSGATASPAADEFVVESSATGGISILTPDASTGYLIFGSPSDSGGPRLSYSYNSAKFVVGTGTAGHSTILKGDDRVTNLTLSGASGSELLTAAGSVSVTDFLRIPDSEVTISGGVVTATGSRHTVDTEGGASSDDLATINGGTEGDILILNPENSARTVVLKDGTGNLLLSGDFSMDSSHDTIMLIYTNSNWREISRSNNA